MCAGVTLTAVAHLVQIYVLAAYQQVFPLVGRNGAGNELVQKSVGVMNWLKASTDAALTLQPASAQVSITPYACSAGTHLPSLSAATARLL